MSLIFLYFLFLIQILRQFPDPRPGKLISYVFLFKCIHRQGLAYGIALGHVTPDLTKELELSLIFNAFGYNLHSQVMPQLDQGVQDKLSSRIREK